MGILEFFLWICVGLLIWTYAGYPLFIWALAWVFPRPCEEGEFIGRVSLIVAAHNEENVIREKVENSLRLDFGDCLHEVIFVSDGSTDSTETILNEYSHRYDGLEIFSYQPRAGKAQALNIGAEKAKGDILIFSDANVMIDVAACKNLLRPFCDEHVGAVCGRVLVKARGTQEIAGESLYMKYEGWIQHSEAKFGSMVGIDGALFALRRELFVPLYPEIILDDFTLSMEAPLAGLRIVYAEDALAVEEVIPSVENEFKRKVRIVSGGYQYVAGLLKRGKTLSWWMWFELISHKVLKWLAPFAMIYVFLANVLFLNQRGYQFLFLCQTFFYLLALFGYLFKDLRKIHLVYIPYYFCVVNLAALIGFFRYWLRGQNALWDKVER